MNQTPAMFYGLLLIAAIALLVPGPARGQGITPENVDRLRPVLQGKVADLPEAPVNTENKEATFTKIDLTKTLTEVDGIRFYAFRFKTPPAGGDLFWAFQLPDWTEGWQILAAEGTMTGFSRYEQKTLLKDLDGLVKKGEDMVQQALGNLLLKPESEYIIWFIGKENISEASLILSVNVLENGNTRELFPMLK